MGTETSVPNSPAFVGAIGGFGGLGVGRHILSVPLIEAPHAVAYVEILSKHFTFHVLLWFILKKFFVCP